MPQNIVKKEIAVGLTQTELVEKAIELCTDVYGKPMVLNGKEDVATFLSFGGEAIVRKDICEKYMPSYLEEFIVDS